MAAPAPTAPQAQQAPQAAQAAQAAQATTAPKAPKRVVAPRDRHLLAALGESLFREIKSARVLLVGAGGIGCELLKNLVLAGFGEIDIVDLDTIDLSNLNRQFLFRHEHIKQSKATIAKETASKFNPNVRINARHANIKDKNFNVDWFKSFRIVFNALDNLDARRHVNRMCLAADVPLIESGTTGYEGQVQAIQKNVTECYDCNPKPTPKSYPVCTIRSTPSQPIHCIVWAKSYLFGEIFGADGAAAVDVDSTEDAENAGEISQLKQEARELEEIRKSMGSDDFAQLVFSKVFDKDIERLRSAEDMWKNRSPPVALKWEDEKSKAADVNALEAAAFDQTAWSQEQNAAIFIDALKRLSTRAKQQNGDGIESADNNPLSFDKDDKDALDFVTSAANLRSIVFSIEPKSEFDVKEMAGNIIPAIATTNAVTASLCVLEAYKILRKQVKRAKTIFLTPRNPGRVISSEPPHAPNADCPVCSVCTATISIDPARAKLQDLVQGVLREKYTYGENVTVNSEVGLIFDYDLEDNLPRVLTELGLGEGETVTIIDDDEEGQDITEGEFAGQKGPRVNLVLSLRHETIPDSEPPIRAPSDLVIQRRTKKSQQPVLENGTTNGQHSDPTGLKRKRAEEDAASSASPLKKAKGDHDNVVVLTEGQPGDGAIILDDD